jgi:hypothetical protein
MSSKRDRLLLRCWVLCAAGFVCATQVPSAPAATSYYFDVNGAVSGFGITTGNTYSWDDPSGFWSTSSAGTVATTGWQQGGFPRFNPTGTPTYTVTVSNDEQVAGMFFQSAQNLTINAIGSGTLDMASGLQGVLGATGADVTINAPITGIGGIQPNNGGNLRFNGVNTYSGGTNFNSTGTLYFFNNGSSFGTGAINMGVAGFVPLLATGGTTVTLANNFTSTTASGAGINFAANANTPVVSTGTWTLGANNLVLRNAGGSTSPLTLSGVISGTANIALSANNAGSVITFSGPNTYSGTTTIIGPGAPGAGSGSVILKLGAANTIASSSGVNLAGGVLDPDGFHHTMRSTTLILSASTAPSSIDYEAGPGEIDFANSSAAPWASGAVLNLANWNPSTTFLEFGTDNTGLTSTQLAQIEFNGSGLGTAQLDSNGFVVQAVPEPSSFLLLGAGAAGLGWYRRRRRA